MCKPPEDESKIVVAGEPPGKANLDMRGRQARIELDRHIERGDGALILLLDLQDQPSRVISCGKSRVQLDRAGSRDLGEIQLFVRVGAPAAEYVRNMRLGEAGKRFRTAIVDAQRLVEEDARRREIFHRTRTIERGVAAGHEVLDVPAPTAVRAAAAGALDQFQLEHTRKARRDLRLESKQIAVPGVTVIGLDRRAGRGVNHARIDANIVGVGPHDATDDIACAVLLAERPGFGVLAPMAEKLDPDDLLKRDHQAYRNGRGRTRQGGIAAETGE